MHYLFHSRIEFSDQYFLSPLQCSGFPVSDAFLTSGVIQVKVNARWLEETSDSSPISAIKHQC